MSLNLEQYIVSTKTNKQRNGNKKKRRRRDQRRDGDDNNSIITKAGGATSAIISRYGPPQGKIPSRDRDKLRDGVIGIQLAE